MNYVVNPGGRSGSVCIPASKSYVHRMLICAALSYDKSVILCDGLSKDILATMDCLKALGADIVLFEKGKMSVTPLMPGKDNDREAVLPCNESGSTLRFLLPIAAAIGRKSVFEMEPGLAARPVDPILNVLNEHGVSVSRDTQSNTISVEGKLQPGDYSIPGNISSQYISGLLMALPLLDGNSRLEITGNLESADYVKITEDVLEFAGIRFEKCDNVYVIPGKQRCRLNIYVDGLSVERDWSNAAFFMCMGALSEKGILLRDMPMNSAQGDKKIIDILKDFGANIQIESDDEKDKASGNSNMDGMLSVFVKKGELKGQIIDASEIPDLVPTIASLASLAEGTTRIINAGRLRIKESDRLKSTSEMLRALGAYVIEEDDALEIHGREYLSGGIADACNDHRIAMAAAVAACGCKGEVTVCGAQCVAKSYPGFWDDFGKLEAEEGKEERQTNEQQLR